MRIAIVISILLGICAFVNGYTHSTLNVDLQPGELIQYYLPEQTGSIGLTFNVVPTEGVSFDASPQLARASDYAFIAGSQYSGYIASKLRDANDWYINFSNKAVERVNFTVRLDVHETMVATGKTMNVSLPARIYQYIRIPAEPNHGLSFGFDVDCGDNDVLGPIEIYAKSASGAFFINEGYWNLNMLWENEDVFVMLHNSQNVDRKCVLSIDSKPTIVLNNGLNTLTVDSSTNTIGVRYVPTSSPGNLVKIETNPPVENIYYDAKRASEESVEGYYAVNGQTVQNFVFDTSNLNDGDQLNVTVTSLPTTMLTSGVSHTFQCTDSNYLYVFALVGDDNHGAVLQVDQMDRISSVYTSFAFSGEIWQHTTPNVDFEAPFTEYAAQNGGIWILTAKCNDDNINATITASLPELKRLSIGKNVIQISNEVETYFMLPEGAGQTSLGVRVNSSNVHGWYYPDYIYHGYEWEINPNQMTDVVYAYGSLTISPAWYFHFGALSAPETVELTLTSIPVVTLESGKAHQFVRPNDDEYDYYVAVAKLESDNGLGHAVTYMYEQDVDSFVRVSVDSLLSPPDRKRAEVGGRLATSSFGKSTYYFAIRCRSSSQSTNLTATLVSATTADDNGVIDFSRNGQADEVYDSYHTFLFPAKNGYNSAFKIENSSSTMVRETAHEFNKGIFVASEDYYFSTYAINGLPTYMVIQNEKGQNATIRVQSIATITLCNSEHDCNGHGSCSANNQQCTCTDGYSGDRCNVPPSSPAPSDDSDNSGAGQLMVAAFQLVAILLFVF